MDVEAKAGNNDDCPTQQSAVTSLSDVQLQCEFCAVKIEDGEDCDEENNDYSVNCSTVADSCRSFTEPPCKASGCCTKVQYCTHHFDDDNSLASSGLKDAELKNSETSIDIKDAEGKLGFVQFDTAEADESSDCHCSTEPKQLTGATDESVIAEVCDNDSYGRSHSQSMLTSECRKVTSDRHQLGDASSSNDLCQYFTVLPQSQTHSTSSLQDAFMQFLKKRQVS